MNIQQRNQLKIDLDFQLMIVKGIAEEARAVQDFGLQGYCYYRRYEIQRQFDYLAKHYPDDWRITLDPDITGKFKAMPHAIEAETV